MASLIVQENGAPRTKPAVNGEEITIQAPCDCSAVTGVMIAGVVFPFYDACGNNVSNIDGKFGSGSLIRVMIDTINTRSYILNQASPVEKFHAAHHAAGGDDPITPTAIGAQNRLAWVTETGIDAMFSGTYSGTEDESAEASSAVLAAIADLQEQVGELEDEIREVAENATGESCDCSKYDAMASAEAARQSAETASQSAENARQNAIAAGGLATQAVASANLAEQRATEAERYAAMAEQAIGKTSYIGDDGNWYAWDALLNDFVNTGVGAQGETGTPGKDGTTFYSCNDMFGNVIGHDYTIWRNTIETNGGSPAVGDFIITADGWLYEVESLYPDYVSATCRQKLRGDNGSSGADGVSCTHSWDGTTLTITSASGTSSADLRGASGADGYTPVKGVDYFDGQPGRDGQDGQDGQPGKDGVIALQSAKVGQIAMITAVDGNGVPTEWKPIDRTHYVDHVEVLPETSLSRNAGEDYFSLPDTLDLIIGREYTVKWNGVEYTCAAVETSSDPVVIGLGNLAAMGVPVDASNEPFAIAEIAGDSNLTIYPLDDSTSLTISIRENIVRKLDNKYLDLDWIPSKTEYVILAEQTVVDNRLEAIDTQYWVENTPVIVYINGIPCKSKIVYFAGDGWYINLDVKISTNINGKVSFLLSEAATQILMANLTGQTVKICLAEYEKIPEEYLPDNNAVQYTAQTLTEAQKAQARQNIGAAAVGEGGSVPSDWLAAEGEPGHVLNRTHYKSVEDFFPEQTVSFDNEEGFYEAETGKAFVAGDTYIVIWGGVRYECVAVVMTAEDGSHVALIGNLPALMGEGDTGEPFVIATQYGSIQIMPFDGSSSQTVRVSETVYHPLERGYLPKMFHVVTLPAMDGPSANETVSVYITDPDGEIIKAFWNHIPVYIDFSLVRGTAQNGYPFIQSLVTAFATIASNDYVRAAIEAGNASTIPFFMTAYEDLNGCTWHFNVNTAPGD